MNHLHLIYIHLATVLPAVFLGTYLILVSDKGSPRHRLFGKIYMSLMLITGIVTLFLPAFVGPRVLGHFGFIHSFSFLTLITVPQAYFAAKRHDIRTHTRAMIGLYIGGILIAGTFALMPGRMLYAWIFG